MYNPEIHHRNSTRLKGYNYAQNGAYYVTICVRNRNCLFGEIVSGSIRLSEYGEIASEEWKRLGNRFQRVTFDVFQIMPNHIHSIICIDNVGATLAVALNVVGVDNSAAHIMDNPQNRTCANRAGASPAPTTITTTTVGNIVGAYKSLTYKRCLDLCKSKNETLGKLWQRNYYEHIIRNDAEYYRISDYIDNNPETWLNDEFWTK